MSRRHRAPKAPPPNLRLSETCTCQAGITADGPADVAVEQVAAWRTAHRCGRAPHGGTTGGQFEIGFGAGTGWSDQ